MARNVPRSGTCRSRSGMPTTRAPSQQRFWWSCHLVSSPAISGTSFIVLPAARMYMADATFWCRRGDGEHHRLDALRVEFGSVDDVPTLM